MNPTEGGFSSQPGTSFGPCVDFHALASSLFAVNGPHFSTSSKVTEAGILRKCAPNRNGRRLHHLLAQGPSLWDFRSYHQLKEYVENAPEDTLFGVLARTKLIQSAKVCHKCGRQMQLRSRIANQRNAPTIEWRCRSSLHGKKIDCSTQSFRNGSIFASAKLDLQKHVEALYSWLNFSDTGRAVDSKGELRSLIAKNLSREPQLGGIDQYVDFAVVPLAGYGSTSHVVLLAERKEGGRVKAQFSSPELVEFVAASVAPGTKLLSKVGAEDTTTVPGWTIYPEAKFASNLPHPLTDDFCHLLNTVTAMRNVVDGAVLNEAVVRFNHRSNFPRFFWTLLSVPNSYASKLLLL